MLSVEGGCFITGLTYMGERFRPSDWVERIATVCGCFDDNRRLHYNPMIKPIHYDGMKGLFVATSIEILNLNTFDYVMNFSLSNNLQVINLGQIGSISNVA